MRQNCALVADFKLFTHQQEASGSISFIFISGPKLQVWRHAGGCCGRESAAATVFLSMWLIRRAVAERFVIFFL